MRVRLTLRHHPRPGWRFLVGGGGRPGEGMWLVQKDDHGRLWLTLLWSVLGRMLSLDVLVPWSAAESIGSHQRAHELAERRIKQ